MKKIYSIVLMAVALFMGTNAMAKDVYTPEELIAAFADKEVSEITLKGNINLTETAVLKDGRSLKLDLGGYTITSNLYAYNYHAPITLVHGSLQVANGTIQNLTDKAKDNIAAIEVFGAGFKDDGQGNYNIKMLGTIGDENFDNWSTLVIGDGEHETNIKAGSTQFDAKAYGAGVEVYGFGDAGIVPSATKAPFLLDLGYKTSSAQAPGGKGKYAAYGVHITVKAKAVVEGGKYGMQIGGNVQQEDNIPNIVVAEGAEIKANNLDKSAAIYGAGIGTWKISGEVHAATGVYVKSGTINVEDKAKIYSDSQNHLDPVGKTSGVQAGGTSIMYESSSAYVGNITINVNGGTIGSAASGGYAIEGLNSIKGSETKVIENLNIQGGTIVAGKEGALETTVLKEAISNGATFEVNGATINTDATDLQDLNTLLTLAGNSTIIAQTEDEEGNTVYVIQEKEDKTTPVTADINVTGGTAYVEWDAAPAGAEITIAEANVKYFSMQSGTLTIPAGKTLKAGSIVLGANAVIDVKPGAKLVITDENGLVANQKGNILLYVEKDAKSTFMLTPKAKANKTPAATVQLKTEAYKNNGERVWQRMGVPAANGIKVSEIVKGSTVSYYLFYWGATEQDWVQITNASYVLQPFQGLELTNDATAAGQTYKFPCDLMGNTNAELPLIGEWTSFANSYMAEIDLYAMMQDVMDDPASAASATTYVNDVDNNDQWPVVTWAALYEWKNDGADAPAHTALKPMQGFILRNKDAATNTSATINYNNSVWAPVFGSAQLKAARNRAMAKTATTRVKINITAENGMKDAIILREGEDYTPAFENGYDAEKNLKVNEVSIYATTEIGNMAEVSTDNLDGLKLNVESKNETSFMMTFSNLKGEQMAIRDNLTGTTITMVEGAEYFFTATEGDNANRFEIIAVKNAPTDVETVVETTGAKAVYTVLGQYMGTTDNWNTLPNGIYVVDGVKMVK